MTMVNPNGFLANVSLDFVLFGVKDGELHVLCIQRVESTDKRYWAIPGGYVLPKEDMDSAANRVLEELTGVKGVYLEQFHVFGEANRVEDDRVITIAHFALINPEHFDLKKGRVVEEIRWHKVKRVPKMVFDHKDVVKKALETLKHKVNYVPIGFELLPKKFTLTELHTMYEAILDKKLDKRNFLKKILKKDFLVDLGEKQQGVAHRAAALYSFDIKKYRALVKNGFVFDV
ncbi:MAG: NUDIX domain-containing protein [Fibrobacterales bacterium]